MTLCSPAHHRVKTCIQCIKRELKREQELNSGEQQKLNFEPKTIQFYTYVPMFIHDEIVTSAQTLSKAMVDTMMKTLADAGWKAPEDLVKQ